VKVHDGVVFVGLLPPAIPSFSVQKQEVLVPR